jgi:hypothetical protein
VWRFRLWLATAGEATLGIVLAFVFSEAAFGSGLWRPLVMHCLVFVAWVLKRAARLSEACGADVAELTAS